MAAVIFDFDNTLFETQSHKARMFRLFEASGAPRTEVLRAYEDLVSPRERMYDMQEHREILESRGYAVPYLDVEQFLEEPLDCHLMLGAKEMLQTLQKRGHRLLLLSKGIESFQRLKIRKSGIEDFFSEIHICQGRKEDAVAKLGAPADAWFVNDNWKETEEVMKRYPGLRPIFFASEYGVSCAAGKTVTVPVAKSCAEILDLIK